MTRALAVVWSIGVLAVSTVPIAVGYAEWWTVLVLVGCVIVPHLLVVLARWVKIPSLWTAVGVGLLAIIAATALGAQPDAARAGVRSDWALGGILSPLIDAIPRLLTAARPAPGDVDLLMPAGLLVWLTSLAVALATTAPGRARIAPLIGAIVLQTAGALLTAGAGDPQGVVAAASVLLVLAGWITTPAWQSDRRPARRTSRIGWLLGLVTAALVGMLAVSASALVGGTRFEPRTLVPPPPLPAQAVNPLPDVSRWNAEADSALFTLASAQGVPELIRLAVLPDFDGASWTLDAGLRPVGVVAEPDLPVGEWRTPVTFRFERGALDSSWIPGVGRASAVRDGDGAGVLIDPDTGSLVAADGSAPERLTVTASVDAPSDTSIAQAGVPPESDAGRYLELPRVPAELVDQAEAVVEGVSGRWEQVTALADFVRADRVLDEGAPSGASYGRIVEFLFASAGDGGQVGTTEQFASSFAVLARAVGLPSRLVVGFSVDAADDVDAGDTGSRVTVTGADARVWAEVYLTRVGWVAVDAAPDSSIRTEHIPPASSTGATPAPEATHPEEQAAGQKASSAPAAGMPSGGGAGGLLVALVGVLVVGLLVVLVVLVVRRARRRARWRRGGALGAWAHVLDALTLAGRPAAAGAVPEQVADAVGAAVGADDIDRGAAGRRAAGAAEVDAASVRELALSLAARAQAAAFGPAGAGGPGSPASSPAASDADWSAALQVERALRGTAARGRRFAWPLIPLS
ncbi:transglutaminase domain-containing protein [Microbacterium sp. ARD32]|uniref:DUF3488 and transglutaminase-like domain-containing protein n=1 Tax=Microbacterium sp. ARD32 TaxID=2962577 RepID=UPI0028811C45|nr:transglutaminase domain-containing protein [Microbacterium sp. ARD32]MDT0157718.1 transglutaminase domain-containing protein [Microbacterium sp. ARD32]